MKLIQEMPRTILRCSCGTGGFKHGTRPDCDSHRERAFLEFQVNWPLWVWRLKFKWHFFQERRRNKRYGY